MSSLRVRDEYRTRPKRLQCLNIYIFLIKRTEGTRHISSSVYSARYCRLVRDPTTSVYRTRRRRNCAFRGKGWDEISQRPYFRRVELTGGVTRQRFWVRTIYIIYEIKSNPQ